tara:strand:+ start:67 stop:240 length:174 start_codon:yes stop_codon:yes gene_type:complete
MTNTNKELFCDIIDYLMKCNSINEHDYWELENIFLGYYPQYAKSEAIRKVRKEIKND